MDPPQEPLSFSFTNCGSTSDPSVIASLQVSPDPIKLGANVTFIVKGSLSETVSATSGHVISLEIYKKFLGAWVYVPCLDGVGSCTIKNLCDLLKPPPSCPVEPWGIPCVCPFPAGAYTISPPGFSIMIPNPNLSWLTNGDLKVKATLTDASGKRLACYEVIGSITS
jgi:hypothetical protein